MSDGALQPSAGGSRLLKLYLSLCSLLVLGDDLSALDRPAVSHNDRLAQSLMTQLKSCRLTC